jgi:hypothetical protein
MWENLIELQKFVGNSIMGSALRIEKAVPQKHSTAFLFQTHKADKLIRTLIERLVEQAAGVCDIYLLVDRETFNEHFPSVLSDGLDVGVLSYDTFELFEEAFEYNRDNAPWLSKRRAFYRTEYLPFVRFFEQLPGYQSFWRCEYDVYYSGDWKDFINNFIDTRADLLTTSLVDFYKSPHWSHFWRYKGTLKVQELIRSHNALFRLTKSGADVLREHIFNERGHYEVILPTVINKLGGLPIEDIGGHGSYVFPDNKGKYYANNTALLSRCSGRLDVAHHTYGSHGNYFYDIGDMKPDYIYHPVKVPKGLKWNPDYCYNV